MNDELRRMCRMVRDNAEKARLYEEYSGLKYLPITERIQTFDDVIKEIGEYNILVSTYKFLTEHDVEDGILDLLKKAMIAEAYNEDIKVEDIFYIPWYRYLTEEKYNFLTEEEKQSCIAFDKDVKLSDDGEVYQSLEIKVYCEYLKSEFISIIPKELGFVEAKLAKDAAMKFMDLYFEKNDNTSS